MFQRMHIIGIGYYPFNNILVENRVRRIINSEISVDRPYNFEICAVHSIYNLNEDVKYKKWNPLKYCIIIFSF